MKKIFEELDFRQTSRGDLSLRRRRVPMLDDEVVYEVILNEEFLMSSLFHAAEDALADLAIQALAGRPEPLDLVVGGLGLGYTAAAALRSPHVGSLRVVEVFPEVIAWHRRGQVPEGAKLAADPRCTFVAADFFALASGDGFGAPHQSFHAILLDIDHTPEHWLHPTHARFYSADGLADLLRHLKPGGIFGMWADGRPDPNFIDLLSKVFCGARAETISFPNPIRGGESCGAIYLASAPERRAS